MNLRDAFPFLHHAKSVSYLDSAASSQKPQRVIDRIAHYYSSEHSNVHRGIYQLAEQATALFESVRKRTAHFLGGVSTQEIIFTSGTTGSLNLVAHSWGSQFLQAGDEILVSIAEHHSNIVPWQLIAKAKGAKVVFIPLNAQRRIDLSEARKLINKRTKVLACGHVSNVLGTIHPIRELIALAKSVGAITVIDGAQALPHFDVNVRDLDCDFYAFSSHKMCGPTGVGVLYGRKEWLEKMPPYQGGGEMVSEVTTEGSNWTDLPHKFEAGTPHIGGVIGFGEALAFLASFDRQKAFSEDLKLSQAFLQHLKKRTNIEVLVDGIEDWTGIISFRHTKIHPHDIATILDSENVCVRAGVHCAQPLLRSLGIPATTRISPYLYNNEDDLAAFFRGLDKVEKLLGA